MHHHSCLVPDNFEFPNLGWHTEALYDDVAGLWERQTETASTSGRPAQSRGPLSLGPHSLADAAARAAPAVVHVGIEGPHGRILNVGLYLPASLIVPHQPSCLLGHH